MNIPEKIFESNFANIYRNSETITSELNSDRINVKTYNYLWFDGVNISIIDRDSGEGFDITIYPNDEGVLELHYNKCQ